MAMVSIYGLNDKIGNVSYYNMEEGFHKPYSEATATLIDQEIKKLTDEQYVRAIKILEENKDKLMLLADKLLEKEVIFKEDLETIFGKRPYDAVVEPIEEIIAESTNGVEIKAEAEEEVSDKKED